MNWIVGASIGVAALAFLLLVIFLAITLMNVSKTVRDLDEKVRSLDPYFRLANKVGEAIEKRAYCARQLREELDEEYEEHVETLTKTRVNTAMEIAEWALVGWALLKKCKERR